MIRPCIVIKYTQSLGMCTRKQVQLPQSPQPFNGPLTPAFHCPGQIYGKPGRSHQEASPTARQEEATSPKARFIAYIPDVLHVRKKALILQNVHPNRQSLEEVSAYFLPSSLVKLNTMFTKSKGGKL